MCVVDYAELELRILAGQADDPHLETMSRVYTGRIPQYEPKPHNIPVPRTLEGARLRAMCRKVFGR